MFYKTISEEQDLSDAVHGITELKLDGNLVSVYRSKFPQPLEAIFGQFESLAMLANTYALPRRLLPYKGTFTWEKRGSEIVLIGMKTRKDTPYSETKKLYNEFERIAQMTGVSKMITVTLPLWNKPIPESVMKHLGWSLEEDMHFLNGKKYSKSINEVA